MLKIYLLDRNAMSLVKDGANYDARIPIKERRIKVQQLSKLKSLDKPSNTISAAFSIWEGQLGRIESEYEKDASLDVEAQELNKFFTKAKTDSNLIRSELPNFSKIFSGESEVNWRSYEKIVFKAQNDLFDRKNIRNAHLWKNEIILLADQLDVPRTHPLVVICLSACFGCEYAHGIIKPMGSVIKRKPYNALSDVMVFSRMIQVMNTIENALKSEGSNKSYTVKFVTFDESLNKILNYMKPKAKGFLSLELGVFRGGYQLPPEMFPMLSESAFLELSELLRSS